MRSQNRKVRITKPGLASVGKVSCLGLLGVGLMLLNPVGSSMSAFAEGDEGEKLGVPVTRSEILVSSVQIAFDDPVGVSSLTPIAADGASAVYSVRASVDVADSGGYTVYLGSSSSELVGVNSGERIGSVGAVTSYEDMPINSWGYSYAEGETAGTTFSAMPANVRGVVLGSNNSTDIKADSKTFTLSFAAHIGNDKPADTYENEVTMSVVSSPREVVGLSSIENMQDMTSGICEASEINETTQLKDIRDGKYYWVAKLADGKCWMTQNLDLDLGVEWPDASLSDYDVATAIYKPVATATTATADTIEPLNVGTRSWSLGDYVIREPERSWDCGSNKNHLGSCGSQFMNVSSLKPSSDAEFYTKNDATYTATEYDAHYLVGNHYQWNVATAGTGGTIAGGPASGSICPKGWKLPAGGTTVTGSFGGLVSIGEIGASVARLASDPYYFVRGGRVSQDLALFLEAGYGGYYWSATSTSVDTSAYTLSFTADATINSAYAGTRNNGRSVRCVAW